jgi:tryptophanyl-tRNA synthetase
MYKTEREPYGLLGYPVLQAADIFLYKPYGVPVGKDQAPHLEIAREIGRRFNHLYGQVFPEFESLISETPTLLGTDGRKMSKSYHNAIYIMDDEEMTAQKIMTAYTDPLKIHKNDPGHPEGCSVFSLHSAYNKANVAFVEKECRGGERGCVQCKKECIAAVNESLRPIRERRKSLDLGDVDRILQQGAEKARTFASKTLAEVKTAMKLY